jgi:hypothetical protein
MPTTTARASHLPHGRRSAAAIGLAVLLTFAACGKSDHATTKAANTTATVGTSAIDGTPSGDATVDAGTTAIDDDLKKLDDDMTAADSVDTEEQDPSK